MEAMSQEELQFRKTLLTIEGGRGDKEITGDALLLLWTVATEHRNLIGELLGDIKHWDRRLSEKCC